MSFDNPRTLPVTNYAVRHNGRKTPLKFSLVRNRRRSSVCCAPSATSMSLPDHVTLDEKTNEIIKHFFLNNDDDQQTYRRDTHQIR
jgi:hypothetical protein